MKEIRFHPALLKEIRSKPAAERLAIGQKIAEAQRHMGQPHLHRGVGLRKLHGNFYEIRVGLKQRLLFEDTADALTFEMIGDHGAVKRFLRQTS